MLQEKGQKTVNYYDISVKYIWAIKNFNDDGCFIPALITFNYF